VGRLDGTRERLLVAVLYVALHPLATALEGQLTSSGGAPAVSLTTAMLVTLLLSVGPLGALAGVLAALLGQALGGGVAGLLSELVGVGAWTVLVLGLERAVGPVGRGAPSRAWRLLLGFCLLVAVTAPALLAWVDAALGAGPGGLGAALGVAFGLFVVTPGMRVLVVRGWPRRDTERIPRVVAVAVLLAAAAAAGIVLSPGGTSSAGTMLVVAAFALLLAQQVGQQPAMVATTVGSVAVLAALAVFADGPAAVPPAEQLGWLVVVVVAMVVAVGSDRSRDAAAELATMFDVARTPTVVVQPLEGTLERVNPAARALLGDGVRSLEDLVARIHVDDRAVMALDRPAAELAARGTGSMRLRDAGGRWRRGRWTASLVQRVGTDRDALLVQFVDDEELEASREQLRRSNAALGRVAGRIQHDLAQPLSAVSGYAETLATHLERLDPPTTRRIAGSLSNAARRAARYLEELVQDASDLERTVAVVDLADVIDDVEQTLSLSLQARGLRVERRLAAPEVRARAAAVREALVNLLGNALKHTDGDVVTVSSVARPGGVLVQVVDRGPGIPVAELDRVFRRGVRLVDDVDGSGSGLAEVREAVEADGGRVTAMPHVGGARFDLWFPTPGAPGGPSDLAVLLAMADDGDAALVRSLLELDDEIRHVGRVTCGHELAAAAGLVRPDVVLVQRQLDDGDALVHLPALADAAPDAQVVLYVSDPSGPALDAVAAAARGAGAATAMTSASLDRGLVARLRALGEGAR